VLLPGFSVAVFIKTLHGTTKMAVHLDDRIPNKVMMCGYRVQLSAAYQRLRETMRVYLLMQLLFMIIHKCVLFKL